MVVCRRLSIQIQIRKPGTTVATRTWLISLFPCKCSSNTEWSEIVPIFECHGWWIIFHLTTFFPQTKRCMLHTSLLLFPWAMFCELHFLVPTTLTLTTKTCNDAYTGANSTHFLRIQLGRNPTRIASYEPVLCGTDSNGDTSPTTKILTFSSLSHIWSWTASLAQQTPSIKSVE